MRQPSPVIAFLTHYLKTTPGATYQSAKAAAEAAGLRVVPLHYGNALRMLGRTDKRTGRTTGPASAIDQPSVAPRRTPRRRDRVTADDLSTMLQGMETMVADRDRFREALIQIGAILKDIV